MQHPKRDGQREKRRLNYTIGVKNRHLISYLLNQKGIFIIGRLKENLQQQNIQKRNRVAIQIILLAATFYSKFKRITR